MEEFKELLSQVLGEYISSTDIHENSLFYTSIDTIRSNETYGDAYNKTINIYELAHKCKEWAWINGGYVININYRWLGTGAVEIVISKNNIPVSIITEEKDGFEFPLEPIYLFKACQWILENKGSN